MCVCVTSTERDPRERQGLNVHAECLTSSAGSGECSVRNVSIGQIPTLRVDNAIGEMQLHANVF